MDNDAPTHGDDIEHIDDIEEEIEEAIEDKRDAVLAADATGMLQSEEFTRVVELREGEVTPPG